MEPASTSLADRFRLALESCESARPKADTTPVISETKTWGALPFSALPSKDPLFLGPSRELPSVTAAAGAQGCQGAGITSGDFRTPHQQPFPYPPVAHPGDATAYKAGAPESMQSRGVFKIVAAVLASLVLAAVAVFLRKKILKFFGKKTSRSEVDVESDDDDSKPSVLSRRERSLKKETPRGPVSSSGLLPQSFRRHTKNLPTWRDSSRTNDVRQHPVEAIPLRQARTHVVPQRRVRIQEPPPQEEEVESEARIELEEDPNFEEL